MIIPNNFKEIKITPNEDGTLKVDYYGVVFKDNEGKEIDTAIVTYPRVIARMDGFVFHKTKSLIEIEILPDNNKQELMTIYVPEEN